MVDAAILVFAGCAGVLLGAGFFGGLWWTIRRGFESQHVALWFLGSLVLRTSVSLAGFYFIAGGEWRRLVACLLGFLGARLVVTRLVGSPIASGNVRAQEIDHAP